MSATLERCTLKPETALIRPQPVPDRVGSILLPDTRGMVNDFEAGGYIDDRDWEGNPQRIPVPRGWLCQRVGLVVNMGEVGHEPGFCIGDWVLFERHKGCEFEEGVLVRNADVQAVWEQ